MEKIPLSLDSISSLISLLFESFSFNGSSSTFSLLTERWGIKFSRIDFLLVLIIFSPRFTSILSLFYVRKLYGNSVISKIKCIKK